VFIVRPVAVVLDQDAIKDALEALPLPGICAKRVGEDDIVVAGKILATRNRPALRATANF
jgi:hypothetical protein